jgi:hypothetical protein
VRNTVFDKIGRKQNFDGDLSVVSMLINLCIKLTQNKVVVIVITIVVIVIVVISAPKEFSK